MTAFHEHPVVEHAETQPDVQESVRGPQARAKGESDELQSRVVSRRVSRRRVADDDEMPGDRGITARLGVPEVSEPESRREAVNAFDVITAHQGEETPATGASGNLKAECPAPRLQGLQVEELLSEPKEMCTGSETLKFLQHKKESEEHESAQDHHANQMTDDPSHGGPGISTEDKVRHQYQHVRLKKSRVCDDRQVEEQEREDPSDGLRPARGFHVQWPTGDQKLGEMSAGEGGEKETVEGAADWSAHRQVQPLLDDLPWQFQLPAKSRRNLHRAFEDAWIESNDGETPRERHSIASSLLGYKRRRRKLVCAYSSPNMSPWEHEGAQQQQQQPNKLKSACPENSPLLEKLQARLQHEHRKEVTRMTVWKTRPNKRVRKWSKRYCQSAHARIQDSQHVPFRNACSDLCRPLTQREADTTILPDLEPASLDSAQKLSEQELEDLVPSVCAAPVDVVLGRTEHNVKLKVGESRGLENCESMLLNTGCYVASMAWAPDSGASILAIGVHSRAQPATTYKKRISGLAAVQLWRVNLDTDPSLRLAFVHYGGCCRSLTWLPSAGTTKRLGLLLMILGDGTLHMHSVPRGPFLEGHQPGENYQSVFLRIPPLWIAPAVHPDAPAGLCDRRLCCVAASVRRSGPEAGVCALASGTDNTTVLLWWLRPSEPLPKAPMSLLHASFLDGPCVWSLAWAPAPDVNLIVGGLANGHVVMWDIRTPHVPVHSFFTAFASPIWDLQWATPSELGFLQTDCFVYSLDTSKIVRARRALNRSSLATGTNCCGHCFLGDAIATAWTDGVLCVQTFGQKGRKGSDPCLVLAKWTLETQGGAADDDDVQTDFQRGAVPDLNIGEVTAAAPPVEASPSQRGSILDAQQQDQSVKQIRLETISRAFLSQQCVALTQLRAWELQKGPGAPFSRLHVTLHVGSSASAVGATDQASKNLKRSVLPSEVPTEPMPLSALAASLWLPPRGGTIAVEDRCWWVACGSASGVVHVFLQHMSQ